MLLTIEICENTIRVWKYIGLLLLVLKITVGILVIVTSTMTVVNVVAKGTAEEMIKAMISIAKKIAAAILVFFVPTIVTTSTNLLTQTQSSDEFAACEACVKEPQGETCTEYITAYDDRDKEEAEKFKQKKLSGQVNTCELGLSSGPSLDFSYKGNGTVKAQLSSHNLRIVERHINDFNATNFHSFINSHGGFKNYTKMLGGIYANYFGKTWRGETMVDLQQASEYVFGYMTMYGFDYFNGHDTPAHDGQKYCKWGGGCIKYKDMEEALAKDPPQVLQYPSGARDAFYPGNSHYDENGLAEPRSNFDAIIQGDNMTTNCNFSVDMVYWKAGIFKRGKREDGTPEWKSSLDFDLIDVNGQIIERLCDLKVGDILHFFEVPVDHTNKKTWKGWKHVAFIGEIDGETGTITVYDGGSYQQHHKNYKWTFNAKGEWPEGLHGYAGWSAVRVKELKIS